MTTRYDASVNGVLLSSLDDRIIVTDVRETAPKTRVSTAEKPVGAGSFFVLSKRQSLDVTVAFVLWERDVAQRKQLLDRVKTWANAGGGNVSIGVNDRPGQYLYARVTDPPVVPSSMRWTDEIQLTFTAYEIPFWRDQEPVVIKTQLELESAMIPGNGEALVDVVLTNKGSNPFSAVWFAAGDTRIGFRDLNIPEGGTLSVYHDSLGFLHAEADGQSILEKRDYSFDYNDDDLVVRCGQVSYFGIVTYGDESPVLEAEFTVQGVYV